MLIIGLDSSGKTSFIEQLKSLYTNVEGLASEKIRPTVGLNVAKFEAFNTSLIFWDLGGASNLRSLWEKYYSEAHGVIFMIDASQKKRFEEAKSTLDRVLASRDLSNCPLLILCNKTDVQGAEKTDEVLESLGLKTMGPAQPFNILPVCAMDGNGVKESVQWLVQTIKTNQRSVGVRT